MKAVILAGGLGTRLRPITYEIPKPLLPVKKKPILNHLIEFFKRHAISEVAILASSGHKNDFERWAESWQKDLSSVQISIFYEEKPRGTFGGMEVLKEWLGDEPFILSNGDELKDFKLDELVSYHKKHKPIGTMALVEVTNPNEYGVPIMDGHTVKEFLEKPTNPPHFFVSSGLYVLSPKVFDYADFSKENIMIEKDIFPKLAEEGKLIGLKMIGGRWFDCGNLERWEKAMKEW